MHEPFFIFNFFNHFQLTLTGWKLVGYVGVLLFGGRWIVQLAVSHLHQRPMLPRTFWYMSLVGALLSLAYFIFGKNDSVGILGYLFPSFVAIYNLMLDSKHRKKDTDPVSAAPEETRVPASESPEPKAVPTV